MSHGNPKGRPRPPAVAYQLEDGVWLVPRFAVAKMVRRNEDHVRKRVQAIACDVATRTTMYDPDMVVAAFQVTRRRARRLTSAR